MEILKDNYSHSEPKQTTQIVTCEKCESELSIDENDINVGEFGVKYYKCPLCNYDNYLDDSTTLTSANIEYPTHFYSYADGMKITNTEINKDIKQVIDTLSADVDYAYTGYGNTFIMAYKSDKELSEVTVIVAKGYQESTVKIPEDIFKGD